MITYARQRWFITSLEVHVDQLVTERRELVTEAHSVRAFLQRRERVRVKLRLDLAVDHFPRRIFQSDVHIVRASRNHLTDRVEMTNVVNGRARTAAYYRQSSFVTLATSKLLGNLLNWLLLRSFLVPTPKPEENPHLDQQSCVE